jgi:tetratricopeptide (TPR) repeat protein
MTWFLAAVLATTTAPGAAPPTPLARGDAAWAVRADGQRDGRAQLERAMRAVDAYQDAVDANPGDLEAWWKLLRALRFAAEFAAEDAARKRALLDRAKAAIDPALARVATPTSGHGIPGDSSAAARTYFWAAVALGTWSRSAGLVATIGAGVTHRLRAYLDAAIALDPEIEDGGPLRLLSRLHAELPQVPWLSGWVDRDQSLPLIERAVAAHPSHPGNRYLLGVTLVERDPARREEGLQLIMETAAREPDPDEVVEQWAIRRDARARLARLTQQARVR